MSDNFTQVTIWLAVILGIVLSFRALVRESDRRRRRTVAEWENEFAAGRGKLAQFVQAGALGLEAILIDEKREAIEYKQDEQQGMMKTGTKGDDETRTAVITDGEN
jgi:hypothetical protein